MTQQTENAIPELLYPVHDDPEELAATVAELRPAEVVEALNALARASVVGVVTFGSFTGSMLPFLIRRIGLDPATASAPFVATLVAVTGIVIYFTIAAFFLRGTLL